MCLLPRDKFIRNVSINWTTVFPGGLYTQNTPFNALYTVGAYSSTDITLQLAPSRSWQILFQNNRMQ